MIFLQITIGNQQVTLNALQVVTLAVRFEITSGISVSGNKPFAAFSGNMAGMVQAEDAFSYVMVMIELFAV